MSIDQGSTSATLWSVDDVVQFLKKTGFEQCESVARANGITGKDLLSLVDEPLSTVQHMLGVNSEEGRKLRQQMRDLRLKNKGNVDMIGRAFMEDKMCTEAPTGTLYPTIRSLASTRMDRLNIVAVGKTGQGKSSTLNTFLHYNGSPEITEFEEMCGLQSGTKSVEQKQIIIHGVNIRLVDTIGLFDTDSEPQEVAKELSRVIQVCSEGIHAFLIVVKMTERLTKESRETISIIRQYFGTHLLDYAFFVLTAADLVQRQDLRQQQVEALAKYTEIDLAPNLVFFFDNTSRDPRQVDQMLEQIALNTERMGGPYTNAAFEVAQEELQKAIQAERDRADEEKRRMIEESVAEIKKASELEKAELHERFKNDREALERALREEEMKTAKAIADAEENAQKKFNLEITEIMRNHEEMLQEKLANQTEQMLLQQKELKEQFDKELNEMREMHARSLEEQRKHIEQSEQKQQEHFRDLMQKTEESHREEMKKLQERQDLLTEERQKREQELREQFNSQINTFQQQMSESCREQRDSFRSMQEEASERHQDQMQLMQQFQTQQLSSLQSQIAALQARECVIL